MAMLQHALAWAERGYRVFPLAPNSRVPAWADWDWRVEASNDPAVISAWWGTGEWNIGCCAGSGTVVVDLDQKNGKDGLGEYLAMGGAFGTLAVRTPTGGMHLYFAGEGRNTSNTIGRGIDTRGDGGYVVAPGSVIDGVAYTVTADAPVAPLPAIIAEAAQRRAEVATSAPLTELDTPQALAAAALWLAEQPPVVEGSRNVTAYWMACELRDRGASAGVALEMLGAWNNENATPPIEYDELETTVLSAYKTAQNPAGAKASAVLLGTGQAPIVVLEDDAPAADAHPAGETPDLSAWALGNVLPLGDVPARPWLYRRLLMRGDVTALAATGAAGKSLATLTLAVHLALGRDWAGFRLAGAGQPGRALIYNAEDGREEQARRLYAACLHMGVDPATVVPHISLVSGKALPKKLRLVEMTREGPQVNAEAAWTLANVCYHQRIDLLVLDPVVKLHRGLNENDNGHMDVLMELLAEIAEKTGVAILVCHHTPKPGAAGTAGYVGSTDAFRGATSITTAARVAFTLAGPTQEDVTRFNLTAKQRERLVRLDDAKMNLALKSDAPVWLEKHTVLLPNGDEVGALAPADMAGRIEGNRTTLADSLYAEMMARGVGSMALREAAAILQDMDPIYGKLTAGQVKARLERFFIEDVPLTRGGALKLTPGEKRMIVLAE